MCCHIHWIPDEQIQQHDVFRLVEGACDVLNEPLEDALDLGLGGRRVGGMGRHSEVIGLGRV